MCEALLMKCAQINGYTLSFQFNASFRHYYVGTYFMYVHEQEQGYYHPRTFILFRLTILYIFRNGNIIVMLMHILGM